MANKRVVDPSEFTDYIGGRELRANALRKANSYDSYANKTEFDVIVLTQPIPLATKNVKPKFFSGEPAEDEAFGAYSFKGRILGSDFLSPHESLPNPCNLAINADPGTAAKITALHTTFISSENQSRVPSIGETVKVVLTPGEHKFNLQYAHFDKLLTATNATQQLSYLRQDCTNLATLFQSFDIEQLKDNDEITLDAGSPTPNNSKSPGRTGLGPPAATEIKPVDGSFFDMLVAPYGTVGVDDSTKLWPATVMNAGNVKINESYPPVQAGFDISSRPQLLRQSPTKSNASQFRPHNGADIAAPQGAPLRATYPGVITFNHASFPSKATTMANATITSKIKFADGSIKTFKITYVHMSSWASSIKNGSIVQQGQYIGLSGGDPKTPGSGGIDWSTSPHLHWEVRVGNVVQAANYLYRATKLPSTTT